MAESREVAVKDSWNTKAMPEKSTIIELNQTYTKEQMDNMKKGLIPQEMEDKWFVYFDESEMKLYFHRSWTGNCVYILQFEEVGGDDSEGQQFLATRVEVNRDPEQYTCTDDESDKETVMDLIQWWF